MAKLCIKLHFFILEKIFEKNPADGNGMTPYHYAAKNGHFEVCQLIMGKWPLILIQWSVNVCLS